MGFPNFGTNVESVHPSAKDSSSAQWLLPCTGDPAWDVLQTTYMGMRDESAITHTVVGGVQCTIGAGHHGEILQSHETRVIHVPGARALPGQNQARVPPESIPIPVSIEVRARICSHFHGAIAGVLLFHTALSPELIDQLWAAGPDAAFSFASSMAVAHSPELPLSNPAAPGIQKAQTAAVVIEHSSVPRISGGPPSRVSTGPKVIAPVLTSNVLVAQLHAIVDHLLVALHPAVRLHRPQPQAPETSVPLFSSLVPRNVSSQNPVIHLPVYAKPGKIEPSWMAAVAAALEKSPRTSATFDECSVGVALCAEAMPGTSAICTQSLRAAVLPHVGSLVAALLSSVIAGGPLPPQQLPVPALFELLATLTRTAATPGSIDAGACDDVAALDQALIAGAMPMVEPAFDVLRRLPPDCLTPSLLDTLFSWITSDSVGTVDDVLYRYRDEGLHAATSERQKRTLQQRAQASSDLQRYVVRACLCDLQTWSGPRVHESVLLRHAQVLLALALASPDLRRLLHDEVGLHVFLRALGELYPSRCLSDGNASRVSHYSQARDAMWALLRFLVTGDGHFSSNRQVLADTASRWAQGGSVPSLSASELIAVMDTISSGRVVADLPRPYTSSYILGSRWRCEIEGTRVAHTAILSPHESSLVDEHVAETLDFLGDFLRLPLSGERLCRELSSAQFGDFIEARFGVTLVSHFSTLAQASSASKLAGERAEELPRITATSSLPTTVSPLKEASVGMPGLSGSLSDGTRMGTAGHQPHASSDSGTSTDDEIEVAYTAAQLARDVASNTALYGGGDLILRLLMSPTATVRTSALSVILHLLQLASKINVAVGSSFDFAGLMTLVSTSPPLAPAALADDTRSEPQNTSTSLIAAPFSVFFSEALPSMESLRPSAVRSFAFVQRCSRDNVFLSIPSPENTIRVPTSIVAAFHSTASRVLSVGVSRHDAVRRDSAASVASLRMGADKDVDGQSAPPSESVAPSAGTMSTRPPRPHATSSSMRYGGRGKAAAPPGARRLPGDVRHASDVTASVEAPEAVGAASQLPASDRASTLRAEPLLSALGHPSIRHITGGLFVGRAFSTGRADSVTSSVSTRDVTAQPTAAAACEAPARCLFPGALSAVSLVGCFSTLLDASVFDNETDAALLTVKTVLLALARCPDAGSRRRLAIPNSVSISDPALVPLLLSSLRHVAVDTVHAVLKSLALGLGAGDSALSVVRIYSESPLKWALPGLRLLCHCFSRAITEGAQCALWESSACEASRILAVLHAADIRRPLGSTSGATLSVPVAPRGSIAGWSFRGMRNLLLSLKLLRTEIGAEHLGSDGSSAVIYGIAALPVRYRAIASSQLLCGVMLAAKLVDSQSAMRQAKGGGGSAPSPASPISQRGPATASPRALSGRFPLASDASRQSSNSSDRSLLPRTRIDDECRRALFAGGEAPFVGGASASSPASPRQQEVASETLTPCQGVWLLGLLLVDEARLFSSTDAHADDDLICSAACEFWTAVILWLQLGLLSGVAKSAALANATPLLVPCDPQDRISGGCARLAVALAMRALLMGAVGHAAAPSDTDVVTIVSLLGEWSLWPSASATSASQQTHPLQLLLASSFLGAVALATPPDLAHLRAIWLESVMSAAAPWIAPAGASVASRLVALSAVLPSNYVLEGAASTANASDAGLSPTLPQPVSSAVASLRMQLVLRLLGRANASQLSSHLSAVLDGCRILLVNEPAYNRVVGRLGAIDEPLSTVSHNEAPPIDRSLGDDDHRTRHVATPVPLSSAPPCSLAASHMVGLRSVEDATRKAVLAVQASRGGLLFATSAFTGP